VPIPTTERENEKGNEAPVDVTIAGQARGQAEGAAVKMRDLGHCGALFTAVPALFTWSAPNL